MSGWTLATHLAIWILILGSVAVFGWFLAELARLRRRRHRTDRDGTDPAAVDRGPSGRGSSPQ